MGNTRTPGPLCLEASYKLISVILLLFVYSGQKKQICAQIRCEMQVKNWCDIKHEVLINFVGV